MGRRRTQTGQTDVDQGIEVSHPLEIGGQRGARIDAADAELRDAVAAANTAERVIATDVLLATTQVVHARRTTELVRYQREAGPYRSSRHQPMTRLGPS